MHLTFSRQVILSPNKRPWCQCAKMLHLPRAEEWTRERKGERGSEREREGGRERGREPRIIEEVCVCVCVCAYELSPQQVAVQRRITHSNRFLWVDCQGNGFLSHICSEEKQRGENKMKRSANRLRARMPLIRRKCTPSASALAPAVGASSSQSLTSDDEEIIW